MNMVYEYCCMAIVIYKNQILFTDETVNYKNRISLPKGHIEEGETHIQTAIRECKEETGVILNKNEFVKELASYEYEFENVYNDNKLTHKTVFPLVFKIKKKKPIHISETNINFASYLSIDELISRCTFPNVAEVLKVVKNFINN